MTIKKITLMSIFILSANFIDNKKSFSNDIQEVYRTLGIEAARQTIYNEFVDCIEFNGSYINHRHLSLLCDRMTVTEKMKAVEEAKKTPEKKKK